MEGTTSFWQGRDADAAREADVLIVGAGITGASTAYWIRRLEPDARVIVLDRGQIAAGASGRNAGFLLRGTAQNFASAVRAQGPEEALWFHRFTEESVTSLLEAIPGEDFDLAMTGSLVAAGDAEEDADLRLTERQLREAGEEVEYWPEDDVAARVGTSGFRGGLFDPAGATIDPVRLVRKVLATSGAEVWERRAVHSLEERAGRHTVTTDQDSFTAPHLILAMNAYLPTLVPRLCRFVRPVRAQMLAGRSAKGFSLALPVYSHRGFFYARTAPDGSLLVGGARHLHEADEVGYADVTTPAVQSDLEAYVREYIPHAGDLDVARRWSGVMGFSPDGLPMVGRLGSTGAHWAAGFTGHGMAFGFGMGRLLARVVLGLESGDESVRFSADRFR